MIKITGIALAAGNGKRMGTEIPKQFLEVNGRPILWYSLKRFEDCEDITDVIVTAPMKDIARVETLCKEWGFKKVTKVIAGGDERYSSVYKALCEINEADYVLIHDCARPCISKELLSELIFDMKRTGASIPAVPIKDTVKTIDEDGYIKANIDRNSLFAVQTPQAFEYKLIKESYDELFACLSAGKMKASGITDDACVVELFGDKKVFLTNGDYRNMKITTPEDMTTASVYLEELCGK